MENSSTDNQIMQLQALAHEVCRSHSARPERDLYRICPSKLSKRELEDLYFALLENNLDLKRTINSQNDKLKMLSTKVQRLSASKTAGVKDKDCCHSKTLINEQKDSITELRKCNERMAERIRVLNMRLCSAKQFLKKQPPEQKNSNKSQSKTPTSFQQFKKICDTNNQLKPHQPAIEYKISKSLEPSPDNPLVIGSPKQEKPHECNENKCKTAIEELQQKINELQEELHLTQFNYASKLHNLEDEIHSVMDENVRARADSRALEERGDDLEDKLRAAQGRGADLETQLAIEKQKVKELETRVKLAGGSDKNLAKSLDQLAVISDNRDSDASAQPSFKIRPRQSVSAPKTESDMESAVSYYKPEQKGSDTSTKTVKEPKPGALKERDERLSIASSKGPRKQSIPVIAEPNRDESEIESDSSPKSSRRQSQTSAKIKEPKPEALKERDDRLSIASSKGPRKQSIPVIEEPNRDESEVESDSSPKSSRRQSQTSAKIKEPKPADLKERDKRLSIASSKGPRKQSIPVIEEPKGGDPEVESLLPVPSQKSYRRESQASVKTKESTRDEPDVESLDPVPSQKSYRRESQASVKTKEPKRGDPEVESLLHVPSHKSYRRASQASVKIKDAPPQEYQIEAVSPKSELEKSPSKGRRKSSIVVNEESKRRESKTQPELSPILGHRKESVASVKLEVPKPTKSNHEGIFPKSDDSGYTDNKSFDVGPEKDEEMLRINRELLRKIADLKSQLDLLMIAAAGAKQNEPAQSKPVVETKMMEDHGVPSKSLSLQSTKVPKKIESKQQGQDTSENKIEKTPSSIKPEVVQSLSQIPKQLPNEDNLSKPYEDKEEKSFSFINNYLGSGNIPRPSIERDKSFVEEKSRIFYDDLIEKPIAYEIRVPRSSVYPELQNRPSNTQEVKYKPNEESSPKPSSSENKILTRTSTDDKLQELPLFGGKTLSSCEVLAQKPLPSDENIPISSINLRKEPSKMQNNTSEYEEKPTTSTPHTNKDQNALEVPLENSLRNYQPYGYKTRRLSFPEDNPESDASDRIKHKSQLSEDKKLIPDEKVHYKDYVDKKRESLFYQDRVSDVNIGLDPIETANEDKIRDSLFSDEVNKPTVPFEDKIYPDGHKYIDDTIAAPDRYLTPEPENIERNRKSSLYAERIEKFSFEKNAPTTSSPYEEKMKKLHDEKLQPEDDTKSIRFESYIHMAENSSRDYGPEFAKNDEPVEEDPKNTSNEKRRRSSIGTGKVDDNGDSQISGPIPSTHISTPIDKKKHRVSIDKTKKVIPEEKTVTILEDTKIPSGYSINFDKNINISKNDAVPEYFDEAENDRKDLGKGKRASIRVGDFHNKPRVSTDFSQVTDNPKELTDRYQNTSYNSKTPQVQSYLNMVGEGDDMPNIQEQSTQMDRHVGWCSTGGRICTCPPGPHVTAAVRTCSGAMRSPPSGLRTCACCNDKNLQASAPRRDSATYTQTGIQPQTYTLPKDVYTQPRRETLDQNTYTQNSKHEYPQQNAYKRDTYTQVRPQNAQTPRYSRSTSPDDTEKEISSLPDLPHEKEIKSIQGYLSPGEKATMTFTDNETNTDNGSLSEGELPTVKKAKKSFDEKGVATISVPGDESTQRMEDVLKSISEELSRCHRLLASQKQNERNINEVNKGVEEYGVQLHASQGTRRLSGAHHVCGFTLHIGTLVLSDEAVLETRDRTLVLTWRFYDQSVTMTRMRGGRVVVFDFSTEYDVVFSEDFLNYMKYEKMPLLICEINGPDKPFASCALPLRDALLHVNRRADMSLALMGGPESPSEEMGVLDLWCILRCDAIITQHLTKSMARASSGANLTSRRSYHHSMIDEDFSNEHMSDDLNLNPKKENTGQESYKQMPTNNKKSYSGYIQPLEEASHPVADILPPAVDDLSTGTSKMSRRKSSIPHQRFNLERKDVSFEGPSNWTGNKLPMSDSVGLIANAVPSNIRSAEEMKAALERNTQQEEDRKIPKADERSLSKKNQFGKLKFTKNLSEDAGESTQDLISTKTSDRKSSQLKYDVSSGKLENELTAKYNDISKLIGSRMDAAKKTVKYYSDDDEQPQRVEKQVDPSPQSIEITVIWLALNEECDAMINPDIKRLYVAYKFLGRNGAELETPVSLPKPKHYVDKCFFNFKKTFHLHDADLPALGHMARVRAGPRVSTDPRDCLVFTVVSEPPEDPLGLSNCEDVGYAYLYLGDILAYSNGSGAYTEVVAVHAARGSAVCGVLAVKIDGLHVLRRALTLSHSTKDSAY